MKKNFSDPQNPDKDFEGLFESIKELITYINQNTHSCNHECIKINDLLSIQ